MKIICNRSKTYANTYKVVVMYHPRCTETITKYGLSGTGIMDNCAS